jgi:hypothetical protein
VIICSCRGISDNDYGETELLKILNDPETIECGKCVIPAEYATLQASTHRTNPTKWRIDWSQTRSDDDGYTILSVEFTHAPTHIKRRRDVSMQFINDATDLTQKCDDLADKYNYEIIENKG